MYKLTIISTPPGATVELTELSLALRLLKRISPALFSSHSHLHGSRLEHPLVARLNLAGYATKEIPLTEGPMEWISLNGHKHGEYFLFKTNHFEVQLDSIAQTFTGEVGTARAW